MKQRAPMTRKQFLAVAGSALLSLGIAKVATLGSTLSTGSGSLGYGNSVYGGPR